MFGTVAFGVPIRLFPQWTEMLERHKRCSLFERGDTLVALGGLTWEKFKKGTENKPLMEKIVAVNSLWNRRPWKSDLKNWGLVDKWSTPLEFCYKGGDCEDYAIAKMLTLQELGVKCPMRLVLGLKDGKGHAVLMVQTDDSHLYILDNVGNAPIPLSEYTGFKPKDSLTRDSAWAHLDKMMIKR